MESISAPTSGVCSVYSPKYVENVFPTMKNVYSGNAIFTFPNSPVKCPGAPQKIMYITDDYLRKVRLHVQIVIFRFFVENSTLFTTVFIMSVLAFCIHGIISKINSRDKINLIFGCLCTCSNSK